MAKAARRSDEAAKSGRVAKSTAKAARSSSVVAEHPESGDEQKSTPAKGSRSQIPTEGAAGDIWIGAGPAYRAATRLQVSGMNTAHEKEKLSITLDRPIVEEIRELSGGAPLSTSINALLRDALSQYHLGELVAQMQAEVGPVTAETYEHVFSQWLEE